LIDLHCHLLPGIDDGARSIDMALLMASMAASDGITVTACTPHIVPGVYHNEGSAIRAAVAKLQGAISDAGIPLRLVTGADVHIAPDLGVRLRSGMALTLNDTRYFLFEPTHHILPPRLEDLTFDLMAAGYVPILTHPERLTWIDGHYELVKKLAQSGLLIQVTAGALTGRFGRRPKYWAERILDEGLCDILATDAHDPEHRAPRLHEGRVLAAQRLGEVEATNLVVTRPGAILNNLSPAQLPPRPAAARAGPTGEGEGSFARVFNRLRGHRR